MSTNIRRSEQPVVFSWEDDSVDQDLNVGDNDVNPDLDIDDNIEQEEDNNTQIPPSIIEDKPTEPSCQRILNIECGIRRSLDLGIVYEDGTRKDVTITKGDKIEVTFIHEAKLQIVRGLIKAILKGPKVLNRITNKIEHMYSIKLDCSTRYTSKEIIIYCELIRDLDIIYTTEDDEIEIDKEYLEDNYFSKNQVDYLISWQDIEGTEIE